MREEYLLAGALAALVVVVAVAGTTVVDARPAFEIPVEDAADEDGFEDPNGDGWTEVPAATVSLGSSGAAVPGGDDASVDRVSVSAVRTDRRLYLRLSWSDATRDASTAEVRGFADAVAVQLPENASRRPPITMGGPDNRVNVWYWSADGGGEELRAGGPGTTTSFDEETVTTNAAYDDGRWRVVFSRSLEASSAGRTEIPTDDDMDVAVGVWNGSDMERSGQKAVSEWHYLALGPGPQGPPYEAILWTVAALAIVATTLITVQGVRRTRGEGK